MSKFAAMELAVEQPSRMTIRHPTTGQPLDGYLDLLSFDGEAARQYDLDISRKRVQQRVTRVTPEMLEEEAIGRLAALTAGWKLCGLDDSPLDVPFNPKNAAELYASNGMKWLREQAAVWMADRANFTAASSKS
jgi:hypothetical protein